MKLSALFAKYLYQQKELRLPGVGVFKIDPSLTVPDSTDKTLPEFIQQIKFEQKQIADADDAFIDFIRAETGKIRPLAISDLDSYLSDGKILLNIGKPFQIDGVGYLQKNREGNYEFTPGEPMLLRHENHPTDHNTENTPRHSSIFTEKVPKNNLRKILLGLGAVVGVVLVVWLGYGLYHRNGGSASQTDSAISEESGQSSKANTILDSVKRIIDSTKNSAVAASPDAWKFVIERTPNKGRALRRLNQISQNRTDIKMESKDSTLFSLYILLPAQPSDTARIKDSLQLWYGRKRVFVEQ